MYFPHAFKKVFVPVVGGSPVTLSYRTSGKTNDLTAGEIGLFKASDYSAISAAPLDNTPFIIAMGSYHANDKIGPFHGGYQESSKSKIINPKFVSRFMKHSAKTAQNQIIMVGWDKNTNGGNETGPAFECGKTYRLRVDLKGSPALRFLSHNIYKTLDAFTGCCEDNCNAGCTGDPVDAAAVLLKFKDQIHQDPILSNFIRAKVFKRVGAGSPVVYTATEVYSEYDESLDSNLTAYTPDTSTPENVIAGLQLEVAYADTRFGDCTWTVTDHFELEPLQIYVSLVDESGDPCAIRDIINSSGGTAEMVKEIQAPQVAQGVGNTVRKDWILENRYRQEPFHDSFNVNHLRMREIEGTDMPLNYVSDTALYDRYQILHNVPRYNNPTSTFDNDQYLVEIIVPAGTVTTNFTNLLQDMIDLGGNGVSLETY